MVAMSESLKKAQKKYIEKLQSDEELRWKKNKANTLRSARLHIRNYSDMETLEELEVLIHERKQKLDKN